MHKIYTANTESNKIYIFIEITLKDKTTKKHVWTFELMN